MAFDRLDERVRQWIWRHGWADLRDIQEHAIHHILDRRGDAIIAAATASGKTEAAFLPICSQLLDGAGRSVRALYVGPLKALINDQFGRLDDLCDALAIPTHRWHGDVAASKKHAVLRAPSGILLITPESLEAIFVNYAARIPEVFAGLEHIVVDELHAFMGSERGQQLQSLLHRIELAIGRRVARIGLSATLGDMQLAAEALRPDAPTDVALIMAASDASEIRLQLRGYFQELVPHRSTGTDAAPIEGGPARDEIDIAQHLFGALHGSSNLIFANSRRAVERYADLLRRACERERVPGEFLPHHGNLSKELRHDVESKLKSAQTPVNVVCTSTLEMGIDIGTVESTAQIGAPPAVSTLRQRLGRSGRRGAPSAMRLYIQEAPISDAIPLEDALRPSLVQSIAMLQLLLARWCEPPPSGAYHLSTLVQQLLSMIAARGGIEAREAWRDLCATGPFARVTSAIFARFLRAIASHDLIEQDANGVLLLGTAGERIVNHYSFYAAFSTPDEFRVVHRNEVLGRVDLMQPAQVGSFIILAGRRWRITAVRPDQSLIEVLPARAGAVPRFPPSGGALVHDRVRAEMLAVYRSTDVPAYLDRPARNLLAEGREHFARHQLDHRRIVRCPDGSLLMPWVGDRVMHTIALQLGTRGLEAAVDAVTIAVDGIEPRALHEHIHALAEAGPFDPVALAATVKNKAREKYDCFIGEDLLDLEYAARALDCHGAWSTLLTISQLAADAP